MMRTLVISRKTKYALLLGIIVLFHTVGLIGLMGDDRAYFLSLSPLNLLLAMSCLLLSIRKNAFLQVEIFTVGLIGFAVELIGIHTHFLFGDYTYGPNLGWKLWGVPLIIAVNWAMLSFCSVACVLHLKIPDYAKALLSAALMTGLDFLIEPVAVEGGFWAWKNDVIPVFNYVCWFAIAFPLHLFLLKRRTVEQNPVSIGLFIVMVVFFGILNCV